MGLNELVSRFTTLQVGGCADVYLEPSSEGELARVLNVCNVFGVHFYVLGRGSNALILDGGIRGLVIRLSHANFSAIDPHEERIHCGAGARLHQVASIAHKFGLAGMEFLKGIPGTIGGALRMNAGAMDSEMFEVIESIRYMDHQGVIVTRARQAIPHEYRNCPVLENNIALSACLVGRQDSAAAIAERMHRYLNQRKCTQPSGSSAGCMFKNPSGISAGQLIEELGMKGTRVGGVQISQKHGNFIINDRKGTAGDVLGLIQMVKSRAFEERGVQLETEVKIIGEPPQQFG